LKTCRAITNSKQVAALGANLKTVGMKYSLLWAVGVATGLRISDLLSLTSSHLLTSCITLVESKTKNFRTVTLAPEVYNFYIAYAFLHKIKPHEFLFHSSRKGRPIKNKPMSRQWANRVIALTASRMRLADVSAHSMRKIYACSLFARTGSIKRVQSDLGHKHMSTTVIYLKDLLEN
jgi:integrase